MHLDQVELSGGLTARQEAERRRALRRYIEWQGRDLPALAYEVCLYLADCFGRGDRAPLIVTLTALSEWHKENDFPDPTQCPSVVDLVQQVRFRLPRRSPSIFQPPPSIMDVQYLAEAHQHRFSPRAPQYINLCEDSIKSTPLFELVACRNRAILLIGFWFGLTIGEVCRLRRKNVKITSNYLEITISPGRGRARYSFQIGRLPLLCPLAALEDWLNYPCNTQDYLFPRTTWKALPGPVSLQRVQDSFKKLLVTSDGWTTSGLQLRYSLYFFLAENGWSRSKILKHLPFYGSDASKRRLDRTWRNTYSHQRPSTIPPAILSAIVSKFEKSIYKTA
ncbi:hypothetical protein ACFW0H_27265 [Pseudomonas sp. CR3202]|uniref:hypothetical protein n=1 Tax=Pseudomonas sp. CR3202 TaxID=3351532 RepID=UPI003BF4449C